MQNLLRWLLRRGSPLPIPNREVKPDCADGTAVMWESMSLPFFMEPFIFDEGFFVLGRVETHPYLYLEPTALSWNHAKLDNVKREGWKWHPFYCFKLKYFCKIKCNKQ